MPDPIKPNWLSKYFDAHRIAQPDATATKGPSLPAQRTIRATPTRANLPEPVGGVLGSLLGIGEGIHNAIAGRAKGYSAKDALKDVASQSGAKDILGGLASGDKAQLAMGALALATNVAPELKAARAANPEVQAIARQFVERNGGIDLPRVTAVNAEKAAHMAKVYESLPKNDPNARAAYDALNAEVSQQFKAMHDAGYKAEFVTEDPYKNSGEMMQDVRENRRLKVFKTPSDNFHPYMTPEQNDQFRAVHDFLAHAGEGHQFGPIGEENAYRVHASTLSPLARQALATETRGQNSWVNFGPNAHLPMKERPFAEQKAALWPAELTGDYDAMPAAKTPVVRVQSPSTPTYAPAATALPEQKDLRRFVGPKIPADRIQSVEDEAHKTYTSPQFLDWLKNGAFGDWYDTKGTQAKAVDALGEEEGPAAFRDLMTKMGATTARSDPNNNLRRASYYRGLDLAGLVDPEALRAGDYKQVPAGMGHFAQRAHHLALANTMEQGGLNPVVNPKPASFVENLTRNFRPYTNDTRMITGSALANPKLIELGAIEQKPAGYTIRNWAYAPMERAAQRAANEAAGHGFLDIPAGADPTAFWQAKIWDALGPVTGGSRSAGTFDDIFNAKLDKAAQMWGVTPGEANSLFWQGNPFDLPLGTNLIPRRIDKGLLQIP